MTNNSDISPLITASLIDFLQSHFALDWDGLHGWRHWRRVRENGLRLADLNGADRSIVEYFAFTHDIQRRSEGHDREHGLRSSLFIRSHLVGMLNLTPAGLDTLCEAVEGHSDGKTHTDITIATCWDADRLDLMRAGIRPNPAYLCTEQARDPQFLAWAIERSLSGE
jgi:uncharacterized protein